jgi:hypothetical protein
MTHRQRLAIIKHRVRTQEWLVGMPSDEGLARALTDTERDEMRERADKLGQAIGARWVAKHRGIDRR